MFHLFDIKALSSGCQGKRTYKHSVIFCHFSHRLNYFSHDHGQRYREG
jgi:hypothetical protein